MRKRLVDGVSHQLRHRHDVDSSHITQARCLLWPKKNLQRLHGHTRSLHTMRALRHSQPRADGRDGRTAGHVWRSATGCPDTCITESPSLAPKHNTPPRRGRSGREPKQEMPDGSVGIELLAE
jgi:hypothetical protein